MHSRNVKCLHFHIYLTWTICSQNQSAWRFACSWRCFQDTFKIYSSTHLRCCYRRQFVSATCNATAFQVNCTLQEKSSPVAFCNTRTWRTNFHLVQFGTSRLRLRWTNIYTVRWSKISGDRRVLCKWEGRLILFSIRIFVFLIWLEVSLITL